MPPLPPRPARRVPALLLAWIALAASAAAQPAPPEFQILNRTGSVAVSVHAVQSGRGNWGRNLVEGRGMRPGQTLMVRTQAGGGCIFDLRMVLIDAPPVEQRGLDICANTRVEFTRANAATPAPPPPRLARATGKPPPGAGVGLEPDPAAPPGGSQVEPDPGARPRAAPPPYAPGQEEAPRGSISSGTGFVVAEGQALTNNHVVEQCRRIVARTARGRDLPARIVARDRELDLALLGLARDAGPPLTFRNAPELRRGDEVVTYGFPLSGILSSGPTLTRGDVSALAGLRDDQNQMQISAPVQRGNSGGPLLDRAGNVVGVIVSKLNAQRVAERTGDIPQNVNFAIKADRAIGFLRRNGVAPRLATSEGERSAAEVGEIADPSTLFLQCFH